MQLGAFGREFGLYFKVILECGSNPRGEKVGGVTGTDSQDLATIVDTFRTIFADLGPGRLSEACTL